MKPSEMSDAQLIEELERRGYPRPAFGYFFGRGGDLESVPSGERDGLFHFFINNREVNRAFWHEKRELLKINLPFLPEV